MTLSLTRARRTPGARRPKPGHRILGLALVVATCWMTLLLEAPTPSGEPVLISTTPSDGSVAKAPPEVRLTFDRPVPAGLGTVRMTKPSGEQVVTGRPYNPPDAPDTLAVAMPQTKYAGTYSVAWSLPSADLEPITGTFRFHVWGPAKPAALPEITSERDPAVVALHTAFRLIATAALTVGVGLAFALAFAWPTGVDHRPARRVITYAWWTLVAGTLGTLVSFGGYAAPTPLGEAFDPALLSAVFGSDIGAALVTRLQVLVPVTVGLALLYAGKPSGTTVERWATAGAVLGCSGAPAATWGMARPPHPDGAALWQQAAEIALLLGVAVAISGPLLLWILLRGPGDTALRTVVVRTVVLRLARAMPICAGLLAAIAVATARGWQLVALVVLAALVAGVGTVARRWVHRQASGRGPALAGRARLRRSAAVGLVAATVALAAATLTAPVPGHSQLALGGPEPIPTPPVHVQ